MSMQCWKCISAKTAPQHPELLKIWVNIIHLWGLGRRNNSNSLSDIHTSSQLQSSTFTLEGVPVRLRRYSFHRPTTSSVEYNSATYTLFPVSLLESFLTRVKVTYQGFNTLFLLPVFCLDDFQSCSLLGLLIPIIGFWSPTSILDRLLSIGFDWQHLSPGVFTTGFNAPLQAPTTLQAQL